METNDTTNNIITEWWSSKNPILIVLPLMVNQSKVNAGTISDSDTVNNRMDRIKLASINKLLVMGASHENFSLIKKLTPAEIKGRLSIVRPKRRAVDSSTEAVKVFLLVH
jgi:hypothetical protein